MSDLFPSLPGTLAAVGRGTWRGVRRLGRGLKKVARVLLFYLLPPLLVIHIAATLITGHLVSKEMRRLADAGHPLTLAEIAPPVPPPGENAADVYQQAFDALRRSDEERDQIFQFLNDRSDDPETVAVAREVVAANGRYYDLLDKASRMPHCVFPVDWEAGADAVFPHWAHMRTATRMLGVRARVLNADGRHDEALADCVVVLRFAEHAKAEPSLIAQLVAISLQSNIMPVLEETLCGGGLSAAASRDAVGQLAPSAQRPSFSLAMQCELAFGLWLFDHVRSSPARGVGELLSQSYPGGHLLRSERWSGTVLVLYRTVGRPLLNLDQLAYLRAWDDYFPAFELQWPESGQRMATTDAAMEVLAPWRTPITRLAFPSFARSAWSRERGTAEVRAAQVALAVAAYRGEHGSYPQSLAGLEAEGWDLPTDPFGGGPYRYRREGDGFVVWSIGPDMDDDNAVRDYLMFSRRATPEEREEDPYDYDVIFRCSG